ncbi:MAG: ATP-binding protein [Acidimicrobiales bacterium]
MLSLPGIEVTTRHSGSVYPFQAQAALDHPGVVIGWDRLGGGAVFSYDPWALYEARVIGSPNAVVLGQLGKGKSALVKSYLARQGAFGRRAYVVDPKGEYHGLARALGAPVLALSPGGGHRLNPLDPGPGPDPAPVELARRRAELVGALAGAGLERALLSEERAAIAEATASLSASATLTDLVAHLLEPSQVMAKALSTTSSSLARAAREVALELHRLVVGDLRGLFDGETSVELDWGGPGLVLDLSALFSSAALVPAMVCAGAWLAQAIFAPGPKAILVVDEAWAILRLVATTRFLQAASKLARSHGCQVVLVVHRLSDLASQADAGTEAARQAEGLVSDAETRIVYAQSPAEAALARRLLGLSGPEAELISRLPPYRALWLVGRHVAVVDHALSATEAAFCDTDARMARS